MVMELWCLKIMILMKDYGNFNNLFLNIKVK